MRRPKRTLLLKTETRQQYIYDGQEVLPPVPDQGIAFREFFFLVVDVQQRYREMQGAIGRDDSWDAVGAIGGFGRAGQLFSLADGHALQALGPARDDLIQAERGRAAVPGGRIENRAVRKFADIVHCDRIRR